MTAREIDFRAVVTDIEDLVEVKSCDNVLKGIRQFLVVCQIFRDVRILGV
jgi:hypothetical protein